MKVLAMNGKAISPSSGKAIADVNLIPENIKKDVSIFGVTGTFLSDFISIEPMKYMSSTISNYSGAENAVLDSAFSGCTMLSTVTFPEAIYIGMSVFHNCSNLVSVSFPSCGFIGINSFQSCSNLSTISLPQCSYIGDGAFYSCINLTSLYLMSTSMCQLANLWALTGTKIASGSGNIYVPQSLLDTYKNGENWRVVSSRFIGV